MFDQLDKLALLKSSLVHLLVLGLLFFSWNSSTQVESKPLPKHVTAVMVERPKPAPKVEKPKPKPKPKVEPKPKPKP